MSKVVFPKAKLAIALAAALTSVSAQTLAQEQGASDANNADIERIQVEGYRGSLIKAKDIKRESVGSQDTILAEDIADFPDLNLAESLQRIPGITITREAGEGRQISLRGLNADFTQVQLNGMEALGTSSSPMDSRGGVNSSRSFDFNIFASELFNQIDVKKSYSANMDEGGIGGTVNLRTAKPFDYDGFKGAVNLQAGKNSLADDTSPRFAGLLSNTWGDFGALVSFAYSNRDTVEQGYNTYRWRPLDANGSDISALTPEQQAKVNSGELRFSRGSRYTQFNSDQTRLGTTLALQYRPSDSFNVGFDGLYGKLDNDRGEFHLQSRGASLTALGCTGPDYNGGARAKCSKLTDIEYNANNEVIYSKWQDTSLHTESRDQYAETDIYQAVLTMDWQLSDAFGVDLKLGTMASDFNSGSAKVYLESFADMEIDYRKDKFYATNRFYNDYDPTNIDEFRFHEIDLSETEVENSFDIAELNTSFIIGQYGTLNSGVSYKKYSHENNNVNQNNLLQDEWQSGELSDIIDPDLTYTNTSHERQSWLSVDVDGVLRQFNVDRNLSQPQRPNKVEEETFAAYLQYDFEIPLGNTYLRGNAGARYYDTEIASSGVVNGENYVTLDSAYDGILPAVNLAWDVAEKVVLRASAGKNVTRPTLASLSVSGTVNTDPLAGSSGLSIGAGNPALEPFESTNYEVSAEYYFDQVGYASVSYFRKNIDNFISNKVVETPYGETGYPLEWIEGEVDEQGNAQTPETLYSFSQPQNLEDSDFSGWEFALQRDFDFLPAPFNNFGTVVNYTIADGDSLHNILVDGEMVPVYRPFLGLSDKTANATLYFETENWGARVSASYRSDYLQGVEVASNDQDESGFHGTTYWDFSAFVNLSENLKLTFEGVNLSNEREEQYSDSDDRLYNTTVSGRTYYVGVNYSF